MTGLVGFKMIEDMTRYGLSVKKIKNFEFADLAMNLENQRAFVADLRGVLMQISKDKNLADSDVVSDFARLLQGTIDGFEQSIEALDADVKLISEHGVQKFLDRIEDARFDAQGVDVPGFMVTPFDEALERLAVNRLANIADLSPTEVDLALNNVFELTDQAIVNKSQFLSSVLMGQQDARKAVEEVTGKTFGVKGSGTGTEADLANFNSAGALLAALAERSYADDFTRATIGYRILDGKVTNDKGCNCSDYILLGSQQRTCRGSGPCRCDRHLPRHVLRRTDGSRTGSSRSPQGRHGTGASCSHGRVVQTTGDTLLGSKGCRRATRHLPSS